MMKEHYQWNYQNHIDWVGLNGNSPYVQMFADEPIYLKQVWLFRPQLYSSFLYGVYITAEKLNKFLQQRFFSNDLMN